MKVTIAYINFWKDSNNDNYFTRFIQENIGPVEIVNPSKNPDILISSVFGNINSICNIRAKCKIFFYGENLNRYPPYNNDKLLYDTFDLIVGFKKTDLSKKQIRFPLWLIYYPYYQYNEKDNILTYIQKKYTENITKRKSIFGTVISRHDRGGQRTLICDQLSKYGHIEAPGLFRKNTQSIGDTSDDKINYISCGLYNVCPENSCYEGYFTEKIFQAFEGGTIPLYWSIGFPEPEIVNKNKYCFCNINKKEELEKAVHDVYTNSNKYIEGDLFNKNAGKQIQLFYSSLLDNISIQLKDKKK